MAGTEKGNGNWTFIREIISPESIGGVRDGALGAMRYSKASIYPGASGPGGYDTGWMGGLDHLAQYRPSEIAHGDALFSPFVAAGWNAAAERNMRPAQWLGYLKIMAALGAEYVESGFFSPELWTKKAHLVQDPRNWCWQTSTPAYAQAVTALWSDLLFEGILVDGGMPVAPITASCGDPRVCAFNPIRPAGPASRSRALPNLLNKRFPEPRSYRFWAGSQDVVVLARKHNSREQVVIVASLQPQSNVVGNMPIARNVTVSIGGRQLHFEARRQGSTYLYTPPPASASASTPAGGTGGGSATFVHLDAWHEAMHPSYWSSDFAFEAELHAGFRAADAYDRPIHSSPRHLGRRRRAVVRTETFALSPRQGVGSSALHLDFTTARSFIRLDDGVPPLEYLFSPRPVDGPSGRRVSHRSFSVEATGRRVAAIGARAMNDTDNESGTEEKPACIVLSLRHGAGRASDTEAVPLAGVTVRVGSACFAKEDVWSSVKLLRFDGADGATEALTQLSTANTAPYTLLVTHTSGGAAVELDALLLTEIK